MKCSDISIDLKYASNCRLYIEQNDNPLLVEEAYYGLLDIFWMQLFQ